MHFIIDPVAPDQTEFSVIEAGTTPPTASQTQLLYPQRSAPPAIDPPATSVSSLGTTFLVLLALCVAGYYLLRRRGSFMAGRTGAQRKLQVSESRSLGNRQFLVVVQFESERLLLGVTPGKIDYLCPLPLQQSDAPITFEEALS